MRKYIRIVGGQYRRTAIDVPDLPGLRPTPDRVRETLFNWLTHLWQGEFAGKQVLDLFAGSGALGFEAASRGVTHVQLVESNRQAILALRKLQDRLKAQTVTIHAGEAQQILTRLDNTKYDLIFLDPPFGQGWFPGLLDRISPLLNSNGLVYIESDSAVDVPENYIAVRHGRAGAVHYQLVKRMTMT